MDTLQWLTETEFGKCIFTMLVSMVPIIELRGGLPFGVALGLPYHLAFPAAVLGNLIPAPFIIVYIRRIFELMRKYLPRLNGLVDQLEEKAHLKGQKVQKYQYIGLWLFVAIPLPGTGAWTGSLVAAFLGMRLKKAMPAVTLGVLTAGAIMLALTAFTGRTKMGKAMRACSEDKSAAQLMGIDVNTTISMTFAIGSALAAVAGVLFCSLTPTTGSMPGIKAFTAAVFGGIGSIPGALLGGILLGIIEIFAKAFNTNISDAVVFLVLIVVLLVKPTGLLGKVVREKV